MEALRPAERRKTDAETVAEAWLLLLKARGVEYLFGNAGTDFPSIIEAFARGQATGADLPVPILAPHENAATCMAHGFYMVSGRPQAVMVHVNVGTANALAGLMNASREQVPILLAAGRTPILEAGASGSRSMPIHWAQEMFDQAGIVREMVRWDYELRDPRQLETVVDRSLAIAMSHPRGPVYCALPREVLAEDATGFAYADPSRLAPSAAPAPNPQAIEQAAAILATARNPVVIATRLGGDPAAVAPFTAFAERFALPVVDYRPRYMNIPNDSPVYAGPEVTPWLEDADALLVLDSDVPWLPADRPPNPDCRVIQAGTDPLFARYPIRGFASDVTIATDMVNLVPPLEAALAKRLDPAGTILAERRARIAARREAVLGRLEVRIAEAGKAQPMGRAWVSRVLSEAIGEDALIVNEYPFAREAARLRRPGTFFGSSSVSGLGWGLPAALGVKLAARDRLVIATLGDGAYMFANPIACHQVARAYDLPILMVVFNNSEWGAVRKATEAMYPKGHAVRANRMALVSLDPGPAYHEVVQTCGGYGEAVPDAETLPGAIERALHAVRVEKRQALLNVTCS